MDRVINREWQANGAEVHKPSDIDADQGGC